MRLRRSAFVVGLLVLALLVAACGGKKQTTDSSASSNAQAVEIVIELGSSSYEFTFNPNEIELKVNQPVRLIAKNVGTIGHDLHIPDLGVSTPVIPAGGQHVVEFTPTKVGTFDMVCHEPGHEAGGMHGTVRVVS